MKAHVHLLEGVEWAVADPPDAFRGVEVEENRQVGHDAARGERVEIPDGLELNAAAESLVRKRRVCVAVGDDDGPARERRTDDLGVGGMPSCSKSLRMADPSGVPSGSLVRTTSSPRAVTHCPRSLQWVDLPEPSTPSTEMRSPRMA